MKLSKDVLDKLIGMNDDYWGIAESVAAQVLKKNGMSDEQIEEKMQEVRKTIGYGYIKVLDEPKK